MRRAARIDSTAKALEAYATSLGFGIARVGGVWDVDLFWGQQVIPVDWKTPGKGITPAQGRLIASGFPLRFISKPEQLDQLQAEMGTHG